MKGKTGFVYWSQDYLLLPQAYVVRREGNSFTLLVCPQGRGQVRPAEGGGGQVQLAGGGGSGPAGRGSSPAGRGGGGSAKIGQQNEYSLHGGRYASCVHAGGLSCSQNIFTVLKKTPWFSFCLNLQTALQLTWSNSWNEDLEILSLWFVKRLQEVGQETPVQKLLTCTWLNQVQKVNEIVISSINTKIQPWINGKSARGQFQKKSQEYKIWKKHSLSHYGK